jgi:hypothetical protein
MYMQVCVCVSLSDLLVRSFQRSHNKAVVISCYVRAGQMSVSISDNARTECFREWNQTVLLKSRFAQPDLIMWGGL